MPFANAASDTVFGVQLFERPSPEHQWGLSYPNGSVWMCGLWFRSEADVRRYAAAAGWSIFAITKLEAQ